MSGLPPDHPADGPRDEHGNLADDLTPFTHSTLFPYSWDGPANPGSLQECSACGAAVVDTDKHTQFHNALQHGKGKYSGQLVWK